MFKFKNIKITKKLKITFSLFVIFTILFYAWVNSYIYWKYEKRIFTLDKVWYHQVWIILWAWAKKWVLSNIYKDRLKTWSEAYKNKKISKILISWDNSTSSYDELKPAWKYLVSLWVDKNDIFFDYAWFDTYQSFYRARNIFKANDITIFTNKYHLPRSLFICNEIWGLKCSWIASDLNNYMFMPRYILRETLANIKAFLSIKIFKPKPHFLWNEVNINLKSNFEE